MRNIKNLVLATPSLPFRSRCLFGIVGIVLLGMSFHGNAGVQKDMATVEVLVKSESEAHRFDGIRQGLSTVLVRLSGYEAILQQEDIQEVLKKGSSYLLQFSYQTLQADHPDYGYFSRTPIFTKYMWSGGDDFPLKRSEDEYRQSLKLLRLTFDEQALVKVLSKAELPVWASSRPPTLVWWASDEGGFRSMYRQGDSKEGLNAFFTHAKRRALSLQLPLLDLQDKQMVELSEVWGLFSDDVEKASRRYGAQVTLTGRSSYHQGKWFAKWQVNFDGVKKEYESSNTDIYKVKSKVIDSLANTLAQTYAVIDSGDSNIITLRVSNVSSARSFGKLESYLRQLVPLESVKLIEVNGTEVEYEVILKSGLEQLQKLLTLDQKLQRDVGKDNPAVEEVEAVPSFLGNSENNKQHYRYIWLGA